MSAGARYMARSFVPTGMRLGSQAMPLVLANPTPPTPSDATDCSMLDFFFDPTTWKACAAAAEKAQIQTVPQNAAIYYPNNPAVQQVAQQAATQQESQAPQDVNTIYNDYGSGNVSIPLWVWIALGVGAIVLVKEVL